MASYEREKRKLLALEIDCLRSPRVSKLQKKNPKHHREEQNANMTINSRQDSKKEIEMVWTPPWPKIDLPVDTTQ